MIKLAQKAQINDFKLTFCRLEIFLPIKLLVLIPIVSTWPGKLGVALVIGSLTISGTKQEIPLMGSTISTLLVDEIYVAFYVAT